MQNLVKKYTLEDNFHFYTKPIAYPAVINMCDLFIRPTNTDGDALSIREAISLKKPAIASDVCKRPEGTIFFKDRNIDDLYIKTTDTINNYEEYRAKIENIEFEDNTEKILEVYKKVLNGKKMEK
jgi:glycosyltransferase involved in cell wall biosynthesis